MLARLGPQTPDDVVQWFTWCDGVRDGPGQIQDDASVIPGSWFPSLDEAVGLRPHYAHEPLLSPHWIPLLVSGGADLYATVWEGDRAAFVVDVIVGEPTLQGFTDIDQMLRYFIACYRQYAFFVDDTGMLDMDPARADDIYDRLVGA